MHVVLDASAAVEFLLATDLGAAVADILRSAESIHAPDLIVSETVSALRTLTLRGEIAATRAGDAVRDLRDIPLTIWPSLPLAARAWDLRNSLTAYDATYVALAEVIEATLIAGDGRLARGASPASSIEVIDITATDDEP